MATRAQFALSSSFGSGLRDLSRVSLEPLMENISLESAESLRHHLLVSLCCVLDRCSEDARRAGISGEAAFEWGDPRANSGVIEGPDWSSGFVSGNWGRYFLIKIAPIC